MLEARNVLYPQQGALAIASSRGTPTTWLLHRLVLVRVAADYDSVMDLVSASGVSMLTMTTALSDPVDMTDPELESASIQQPRSKHTVRLHLSEGLRSHDFAGVSNEHDYFVTLRR